jgi:hypothetical protein
VWPELIIFKKKVRKKQDSPHIVKTGRLDFSLSLDLRENLGDFRKSIQILTFLFPLLHVPLPFTKTNVLHYDLKKDAINEFGIKYWTSNPVWVTFQEHGSSFYVNIEKTDKATKTSLFDRNWAISLKPRRRSRPLRLVWWALKKNALVGLIFFGWELSKFYPANTSVQWQDNCHQRSIICRFKSNDANNRWQNW